MKIRNGFVSNSSSTAFVLMTTEENFKKSISNLKGWQKEILNIISTKNLKPFLGHKIISIEIFSTESVLEGLGLGLYEGCFPKTEKHINEVKEAEISSLPDYKKVYYYYNLESSIWDAIEDLEKELEKISKDSYMSKHYDG